MSIGISGNNGQYDYAIYDGQDVAVSGTGNVFQNCVIADGFDASENCTVKNSIFLGAISVATGKTLTLLNCISSGAEPAVDGTVDDTDCMWSTDPLLLDPDNGDFRPGAGSPARSGGIDVDLTEDYIGTAVPDGSPDIGAYQTALIVGLDSSHALRSAIADLTLSFEGGNLMITDLPVAPTPGDSTSEFNTKAFGLLAALSLFVTEANQAVDDINSNGAASIASAAQAAQSELAAEAAYASAAAAANAEKWVSGTTYAEGDVRWSPADYQTYRRKTAGGGTTDPSEDEANWAQCAGSVMDIVDYEDIPIEWGRDGSSPPDYVDFYSDIPAREFANDSTEDVVFPWYTPKDLNPTYGIKFQVDAIVTNATGPASEGIAFELAGRCAGHGDSAAGTYGDPVESTATGLAMDQYDEIQTTLSDIVTVTDLAAGETAKLKLVRDHDNAADTYGQKVGVYNLRIWFVRSTVAA